MAQGQARRLPSSGALLDRVPSQGSRDSTTCQDHFLEQQYLEGSLGGLGGEPAERTSGESLADFLKKKNSFGREYIQVGGKGGAEKISSRFHTQGRARRGAQSQDSGVMT